MAQFENIYNRRWRPHGQLRLIFVAAYMNTQDYAALISLGIIVGVLASSLKMMWGEGYLETFKWFIIVAVISSIGLGTKASVVIFDKTKADHPIAIVDNVPYFFGSPWAYDHKFWLSCG